MFSGLTIFNRVKNKGGGNRREYTIFPETIGPAVGARRERKRQEIWYPEQIRNNFLFLCSSFIQ